ncbi:MAG: ComF family protein [Nocardioidaceae bacterium]
MTNLRRHPLAAAAGDLVIGNRCAGCAAPGLQLCSECLAALAPRTRRCWPDPCPGVLVAPPPVTPWCAAAYAAVTRRVLIEFKENRRDGLAKPLARLLTAALAAAMAQPPASKGWILVPMPSRRATVRTRGYDAVMLLARIAAGQLRRDGHDVVVTRSLRHRRRVADQAGLNAQQRHDNLDGALRGVVRRWPAGRQAIAVDDVITTGATLSAAVHALREAGADIRRAAVVAATPRETSPGRRAADREWD